MLKHIHKSGCALLGIFILSSAFLSAQNSILKLDSDVWPPFTNVRPEKTIAMDIVEEALSRMEITAQFSITDFEEVLPGIDSGTYDGSAALWKNEEREESLLFSAPFLENQLVLVGRKGETLDLTEASMNKQVLIGGVQNYAYGDSLFGNANIELVFSESDRSRPFR